jgi:hypothetical protein
LQSGRFRSLYFAAGLFERGHGESVVALRKTIIRSVRRFSDTLDPDDKGTFPEPMPDYDCLRQVYSNLLKINKEYYQLVHRYLGRELEKLSESVS